MVAMLVLAAAALAVAPPAPRMSASAQAIATITVINGMRLHLDGSPNPGAPAPHDSTVKSPDGSDRSAKLIEFQ